MSKFTARSLALAACVFAATQSHAQSAMTYQGRLDQSGLPVNGVYDFQVRVYNAATAGSQSAPSACIWDVTVVNGLFTLNFDPGTIFGSGSRWLEIRVRANGTNDCNAMNTVTPLTRQQLTASPLSTYSISTRGFTVNSATASDRALVLDQNGNLASRASASDRIPVSIASTNTGEWLSYRSDAGTERFRILQGPSGELNFSYNTGSALQTRVVIGTTSTTALTVPGTTTTQVLTITGGADIAEPFDINVPENTEVVPGMVVSIDADNTGELRVSDKPYDTAVAGIVSGANGVNPGLTLSQPGTVANGKHPVALTGRVWVLADADANGSIVSGDLLTTSSTLGHAMKATDRDNASGASIGKAMSSLEKGKGYVLTLVNLH